MKAVLVYQAGIANVFQVEMITEDPAHRGTKRLLQYDFKSCEWYAQGLKRAGWEVETACCNQAGDIIDSAWSFDLSEAPFRESFVPVSSSQRV